MTLPPEIWSLSAWTELCEIHDWDEEEAASCIERFVHSKAPIPTGRGRELCETLVRMLTLTRLRDDPKPTLSD